MCRSQALGISIYLSKGLSNELVKICNLSSPDDNFPLTITTLTTSRVKHRMEFLPFSSSCSSLDQAS